MQNERLKHLGRLEERKMEARKLELKLRGLRDAIRDVLDPFERLDEIEGEQAASQAVEFATVQAQYREVLAEIAAIQKALGKG
jgi:hypothetical protein